jgi:hypothetical protein
MIDPIMMERERRARIEKAVEECRAILADLPFAERQTAVEIISAWLALEERAYIRGPEARN